MPRYAVWYMKPSFFSKGMMGHEELKKNNLLPTWATITNTHVHVRDLKASSLEEVFTEMQGEVWSPNGEAMKMLEFKGLQHTSMTVGDIVVEYDTGKPHMCGVHGWVELA